MKRLTTCESLSVSYFIARSISLKWAGENNKPSHPPSSIVTMHTNFLTHGVRLPFHHFLRYMLSNFKCVPAPLSLIVWHAMIGIYILWKLRNLHGPTFQQFQFCYQLMANPNPNQGPPIKCWYYVHTWPKLSPLIVQKKSFGGSWKKSWFFASGD